MTGLTDDDSYKRQLTILDVEFTMNELLKAPVKKDDEAKSSFMKIFVKPLQEMNEHIIDKTDPNTPSEKKVFTLEYMNVGDTFYFRNLEITKDDVALEKGFEFRVLHKLSDAEIENAKKGIYLKGLEQKHYFKKDIYDKITTQFLSHVSIPVNIIHFSQTDKLRIQIYAYNSRPWRSPYNNIATELPEQAKRTEDVATEGGISISPTKFQIDGKETEAYPTLAVLTITAEKPNEYSKETPDSKGIFEANVNTSGTRRIEIPYTGFHAADSSYRFEYAEPLSTPVPIGGKGRRSKKNKNKNKNKNKKRKTMKKSKKSCK